MAEGNKLNVFKEKYPERFIDVGIAEEHAVSLAAGISLAGHLPIVSIYSSFLERAFDQILIDVASQNTPVIFLIDRAGVVNSEGKTHQGTFDLSYLNLMPNMVIISPKCVLELKPILKYALKANKPVAIRYPKGTDIYPLIPLKEVTFGKWEIVCKGKNVIVLAVGKMVSYALLAKEKCKCKPIVVNALFVKPLDINLLKEIIKADLNVLTLEDNQKIGGFGQNVLSTLNELGFKRKIKIIAHQDKFLEQGSLEEIYEEEGFNPQKIAEEIDSLGMRNENEKTSSSFTR
jgi:1-deoxy-D-xylulose-5-phosphate synthase